MKPVIGKNFQYDLVSLCQLNFFSLLKNGSVRYLGISTFGIWGMIDASECVPTYNSGSKILQKKNAHHVISCYFSRLQ